MLKKIGILILLLVITTIPTIAGTVIKSIDEQAQSIFNTARSSKKGEKINIGISKINELVKQGYDTYRADFRIASLISQKAGIVWLPNEKMDFVNKGVKKFNKVYRKIKKLPNNEFYLYEFKFYRGVTFSNFPSFLGKNKIALQDLEEAEKLSEKLKITEELELAILYSRLMYMYKEKNQIQKAKIYAKKILSFKKTDKTVQDYKKQAKKIIKEKK